MKIGEFLKKYGPEILLSLLAAVGGGFITYYSAIRVEERKLYFEERKSSYETFFAATVKRWDAEDNQSQANQMKKDGNAANAEKTEAKAKELFAESTSLYGQSHFKIGVFGDAKVIQAIAIYRRDHFGKGECRTSRQQMLDDVAVYQNMRRAMGANGEVSDDDLAILLFDCRLPK